MNFFRSHFATHHDSSPTPPNPSLLSSSSSPRKTKAERRVSVRTGAIARKLRFDGTAMTEDEIVEWLHEVMENEQYTTLSFEEDCMTPSIFATWMQVCAAMTQRHKSYWERCDVEFCKGPGVDIMICTALVLNCIKHLFLAGDGGSGGPPLDRNANDDHQHLPQPLLEQQQQQQQQQGLVIKVAAALRINRYGLCGFCIHSRWRMPWRWVKPWQLMNPSTN